MTIPGKLHDDVQKFSLLFQAAPTSDGGCAAASEGGRGLSASLPHGPLRDPLAPVRAMSTLLRSRRVAGFRILTDASGPVRHFRDGSSQALTEIGLQRNGPSGRPFGGRFDPAIGTSSHFAWCARLVRRSM